MSNIFNNASLLGNIGGYQALLNQFNSFFGNSFIDVGNFVDVFISDKLFFTSTSNQIVFGNSPNQLTLSSISQTSNNTATIPDIGSVLTANFILSDYHSNTVGQNQTINSGLTLAGSINFSALSASLPLQLDSSKNVIAQAISLTTSQITGILPIANGGTNSGTALTNGKLMESLGGMIVEGTSSSNPSFTSVTATSKIITPIINNGNDILVPNATDTFALLALSQTLTNKILSDTTTAIGNVSDSTKQIKFDTSGNTTSVVLTLASNQSTNQSLGIPNIGGINDFIVTNRSTSILTNKTVIDSTFTIANNSDNTKILTFTNSGNTTGISLNIRPNQTTNQSLGIPNVSSGDLFVTNNTSATIINKTVLDGSFTIANSTDSTKKILFNSQGNTTGISLSIASNNTTGQTLNIPNVGAGDEFVTNKVAATLLSKTLSSPIFSGTSTGILQNSTNYSFSAYQSVGQTIGLTTQTKITFTSTEYNVGSGYSTSTSVFTAPAAGKYLMRTSISINFGVGATSYALYFNFNGILTIIYGTNAVVGPANILTGSRVFNLSANDTIDVEIFINGAGGNTINTGAGDSWFQGELLVNN